MPADRGRDWRVLLFRVAAVLALFVCLAAGGVFSLQVPWGSPGRGFPGFTAELHRWHSALLGVSEGILLPGALLGLLARPRSAPLLMQYFVVAGASLAVPHLLTRGSTPVASAFLVLPLAAYPALSSLRRVPPERRWSAPLLGLSLLAAAALAFDFARNLQWQVAGIGGEHHRQGHWATASSLFLALVLAGVCAASRQPGWRALGLMAGLSFLYLGAAAIRVPEHAGSWGVPGGICSVLGGAAFLAVTWREARDSPGASSGP